MATAQTGVPAGRIKLKSLHVTIDRKPYQIVHMNIADVLIAGAPDWIVPKQKLEFSFVVRLPNGTDRPMPTYGVVISNDKNGLEVRYNPPAQRWRDILAKIISDEAKGK